MHCCLRFLPAVCTSVCLYYCYTIVSSCGMGIIFILWRWITSISIIKVITSTLYIIKTLDKHYLPERIVTPQWICKADEVFGYNYCKQNVRSHFTLYLSLCIFHYYYECWLKTCCKIERLLKNFHVFGCRIFQSLKNENTLKL